MEGLVKVMTPLTETYVKNNSLIPSTTTAKDFFEARIPPSDKKEVNEEFKRTLVLSAQKKKPKHNTEKLRLSKKYLTSRERRDLSVHRLPKKGLKYDMFKPLHALWKDYIKELLDLEMVEGQGWVPGLREDPKQDNLQMKICRADLHGALIKVSLASTPSHVGMEGIIALETRHTIQIISKDNKVRIIPKKGSSFTFKVSDYVFTLPGSSIEAKPGERTTKKLKQRVPFDF
jgi:ribonuclease P protein subunit POP4